MMNKKAEIRARVDLSAGLLETYIKGNPIAAYILMGDIVQRMAVALLKVDDVSKEEAIKEVIRNIEKAANRPPRPGVGIEIDLSR